MNAMLSRLDQETHRTVMLKILLKISSDPTLARNLVFKGGTALYFFHGLDRFSTDLDFDLIDIGKQDLVYQKITSILSEMGEVKNVYNKANTIFGMLSYGRIDHNIKVEISKRGVAGRYSYQNLVGIQLLVMEIEDLFAQKLFALSNRRNLANRDIYDIHFLLNKGVKMNKECLEILTGETFTNYIDSCVTFLESLPKKHNILDGLGDILSASQKSFVKEYLIRDTIFLLHAYR